MDNKTINVVVATTKEWNIDNYFKIKKHYENRIQFHLVTNKKELTKKYLLTLNPKYIFFPHWSWIISQEIYNHFECVLFHMTDLPYGRGGSPLQNLIIREVYDTKISALKVTSNIDEGDIYIKENFNISIGSAEENFIKLSNIIFEKMIPKILTSNITPSKQIGDIVEFKRRTLEESNIYTLKNKSLDKLYDFIRMLDADGYPKAYIEMDNVKIEFNEVCKKNSDLAGRFRITKIE
jgi:methionyl-tRNA formyltransferase